MHPNDAILRIGIQGGRGSFNDEAARHHLRRIPIAAAELVYLYTTENVLLALDDGRIDQGQFAVRNTLGGDVAESAVAMAQHPFVVVDEYTIRIAHALMVARSANVADANTVMTHPQVIRQCMRNLTERYPHLRPMSGEGDLIDHAKVAELLAAGTIAATTATAGSAVLAEVYGLDVVERSLQDSDNNFTTFLLVRRPE